MLLHSAGLVENQDGMAGRRCASQVGDFLGRVENGQIAHPTNCQPAPHFIAIHNAEAATSRGPEAVVAADLAQGAFLIAVPFVQPTSRHKRVNISLDAGTLGAIDGAAEGLGLTQSRFLTMAAPNESRG